MKSTFLWFSPPLIGEKDRRGRRHTSHRVADRWTQGRRFESEFASFVPERLKIDRAGFIEQLRRLNAGSGVHFIPIHLHPYSRDRYGYQLDAFPVALREYNRMLSLPLSPAPDEDVADVIEAVTAIVQRFRAGRSKSRRFASKAKTPTD